MRLLTRCLLVVLAVSFFASLASDVQAEDKVVGIIWEFGRRQPNKKIKWQIQFRATPDGKVWNMPDNGIPRVVGSWKGDEEKTKMTIDKIRHPVNHKFNGDYEFVLVGKDPKIWQGLFWLPDGKGKVPIYVRMVKD